MRRLSVASLDSGAQSPVYDKDPSAAAVRMDPRARAARPGYLFGGIAGLRVRRGCPPPDITPDITMAANGIPGLVGAGTPRAAASCHMSVVDQQGGRWYVEDIRASQQSMGVR